MHPTLRFCRNTDPHINFVGHVPPCSALSSPALYNQRVNKHCDKKSSIVREYHSARVHNCGVLTTDLLAETINSRQPMSSIYMDNIGCSNAKRFNYIAQYSEGKYYRKYGKRNDLDVNRTEDDLTDSNYNFMTNRIEQTEMKVIHTLLKLWC